MPDAVAFLIWFIASNAGGNAAGELLKGGYDLGPEMCFRSNRRRCRYTSPLIAALRGIDYGLIVGQVIVAVRLWVRSDGHRRRGADLPALRRRR